MELGRSLSSTFVSLPCEAVLSNPQELDLTAPVEVCASRISLRAPSLVLRPPTNANGEKHVLLEAESIDCTAETIAANGVDLSISSYRPNRVDIPSC